MVIMGKKSLKKGLRKILDKTTQPQAAHRPVNEMLENYYKHHEELRGIPKDIIRKAWFNMAHLLLAPGSQVADMASNDGITTYVMAVLNPELHFTGIDIDKKAVSEAKKNYQRANLEFRVDDMSAIKTFKENSLDAVVNSFCLHETYSHGKYHDYPVLDTLEHQFSLLKPDGMMLVRDYALLSPDDFVLMEMPDIDSPDDTIARMSEVDLLIWYSENAKPIDEKSCHGFFLEELPPRLPGTRLFRLPYKWAYEFILRKDDRKNWEREIAKEYTFFTQREHRKYLRAMGARVLYTAPHWDDAVISHCYDGHFRLFRDDGTPIGAPPTSFIAIAQKKDERKSLRLHERRPSHSPDQSIRVQAMRNELTGDIIDIVRRDINITEILPYRITEDGALHVYVNDSVPRGIVNAVPRAGKELDDKRWSGHMVEPLSLPSEIVRQIDERAHKDVVLFARDYLGMKPAAGSLLEKAPAFLPAPDFIDEVIETRYLRVLEHDGPVQPKHLPDDVKGFTTGGTIREINAQKLLNAIAVGFIPNARLEMQIMNLYEKCGLKAETWSDCPLALNEGKPRQSLDVQKYLNTIANDDKRFKDIKGSAGKARPIKSIFVDEGWSEGGIEGLAARDVDFVISDDMTINKAVVLPLTKDAASDEILAGIVTEYLPVPQRHKGNGMTIRAPSFNFPKEVTNIDQAKKYVAEQFNTTPDKVARLGESYFCHIGMTPVRLFPFVVATMGESAGPIGGPVQYAPIVELYDMLFKVWCWDIDIVFLWKVKSTYVNLAQGSELSLGISPSLEQRSQYNLLRDKPVPKLKEVAAPEDKPTASSSGVRRASKAKNRGRDNDTTSLSSVTSSPDFVDIRHGVDTSFRTPRPDRTKEHKPQRDKEKN